METEPDITTAVCGIVNKSLEVTELQHPHKQNYLITT